MNNEILIYSELFEFLIIEKILKDFKIKTFYLDELKKQKHSNKNIIIFLNNLNNKDCFKIIDKISSNNSVLCLTNQQHIIQSFNHTTVLLSPITLSKFKDRVLRAFNKDTKEYLDIVISEKKIINKKNKKFTFFTDLENQIFSKLLEKKELDKKFLKENILNIKNNIDTRSIESHFSRIRKKLSMIESSIKITSREDIFFIN